MLRRWFAVLCLPLLLCRFSPGHAQAVPVGAPPGVTVLTTADGRWAMRMVLKDYLQEYVFPEELLSYQFTCPTQQVRREHLRLVDADSGKELPYQLAEVRAEGDFLVSATLRFRASLNKGQTRTFLLSDDPAYRADFVDGVVLRDLDAQAHTAVLDAGSQQVMVPYGTWAPGTALSAVPAPLLRVSRQYGAWVGRGWFSGAARVQTISAGITEDGPLRLVYRITYTLEDDRRYTVVLTAQHRDAFITVDEYLTGMREEENLRFNFSYRDGIDPDGRLAMANNGDYLERSGRYDANAANGRLPYSLGIFGPNVACPRTTLFYRNDAPADGNAICFSLYRLHQWKTHLRYTWWTASVAPENLYFYSGADKYLSTQLLGEERHWALAIIPRADAAIQSQDGSRKVYWAANTTMTGWDNKFRGGDPAARLFQRLGAYSLDWVKELVFEFDEDVNVLYDGHDEALSYDEFNKGGKVGSMWDGMFWWGGGDWQWRWLPVERYQDGMCYGAKAPGRTHWQLLAAYAASRKNWTPEQRLKVRSWIIHFVATYMFLDDNLPHESMVAGHPNFLIESLYPGVFAAIFPQHPYNARFEAIYQKLLNEYFHVYVREANPALGALGGRHTENIACYSFASLAGVLHNAQGFRQWRGVNILTDPAFSRWINWHMQTLITAGERRSWEFHHNPYTLTPPEGAHAAQTKDVLYTAARYLDEIGDPLGSQLHWCLTKGEDGRRPALDSVLFYDYGPVLRYDFGGPHEAYLQMQHLGQADPIPGYAMSGMHYRWSGSGNGTLYYAAQGKTWSWNKTEDNGDAFDIRGLCAFEVPGSPMGYRKIDATTHFRNFGAVQYFRSTEDPEHAYVSRGVMMVRDRYLAVYDDVKDAQTTGTFRWVNQTNGVKVECFDQADFTAPATSFVEAGRFVIAHTPPAYDTTKGQALVKDWGLREMTDFSARFTTRVTARWTSTVFVQRLGPGDQGKLWINGNVVLEGGDGAQCTVELKEGQAYDLRYEYIHRDGPIRIALNWGTPGGRATPIEGVACTYRRALPAIHAVRAGAGDQLHIVEPFTTAQVTVTPVPGGARLTDAAGKRAWLFMSDRTAEYRADTVTFRGRTGYATADELALFEGTHLQVGDFGIETNGGEFGISASRAGDRLEGRFAGNSGGTVTIILPKGFNGQRHVLRINDQPAPFTYDPAKRTVTFAVDIAMRDGYKTYRFAAATR